MSHGFPFLALLAFTLLVATSLLRLALSGCKEEEILPAACRQILLHGLTLLGIMTLWSVLRADLCWVWWSVGFQVLAVVASFDGQRDRSVPLALRLVNGSQKSTRRER